MCLTEFNEKVFVKGIHEEGYDEGYDDGILIGEAKGMKLGEAKGKAESVIEFLEDCGAPSEPLRALIMSQTDLDVLKKWNKLAARATSIADFEEKAFKQFPIK